MAEKRLEVPPHEDRPMSGAAICQMCGATNVVKYDGRLHIFVCKVCRNEIVAWYERRSRTGR